MIKILKNDEKTITIKKYPFEQSLLYIFIPIIISAVVYQACVYESLSSSLTCTKNWLNTTNCQIQESSWLNPNLIEQKVTNLKHVEKAVSGRSRRIFLKREIRLRGNMANVYFPHSSLLFHLYGSNYQLSLDVDKINSFIAEGKRSEVLTIDKQPSLIFYKFFVGIFLLFSIVGDAMAILLTPVTEFSFNFIDKKVAINETALLNRNKKYYSFDELKIVPYNAGKQIGFSIKSQEKYYYIDSFETETDVIDILVKLKQHIS